ncbi:pseudouridine synthase [Burkholderiaceae bacterium DAT-1]|nr:pseudouridine synthase [Burkholderiaceae bacterium DAT-1]
MNRQKTCVTTPLPIRDGIAPSFVNLPAGSWRTLGEFLTARFPHLPAEALLDKLTRGEIIDDIGQTLAPEQPYQAGGRLWYYREVPPEIPVPFEATILYRDDRIVVADKPHFLPTTPGGKYLKESLLYRLRNELGLPDLTVLHRLDRETAGIVVCCIHPEHRGAYQTLFESRAVQKTYEAIAPLPDHGRDEWTRRSRIETGDPFHVMREVDGTPNAETHFKLIEADASMGRYQLSPLTGKKHQLRVHMAASGIPILHDSLYPDVLYREDSDYSQPLQLHACSISFKDPFNGVLRNFVSMYKLPPI